MSPSRLDGADLDRPFWGIRTPQAAKENSSGPAHPVPVRQTDVETLCTALRVRMRPDAFFSHVTAALLLGLPVPWRLARLRPVHVSCAAPARAMVARDIVGHSLRIERPPGAAAAAHPFGVAEGVGAARHHRARRPARRSDIRRLGRLEDAGWQVLQFTDDDLHDPAALVARVARRLRARGADVGR